MTEGTGCGQGLLAAMTRRKQLPPDVLTTPLNRCLNTFDLTLLGIGHMVGAGIYVITGTVVKNVAGPGVILSYLLAGFAALLASLCYAEFGAKIPKAGSAYSYTYVTMGEAWAFFVGWNIILEHILGAASVARAWSGAIDALSGGLIKNGTMAYVGHMHGGKYLSEYPDLLAVAGILLMALCVALGARTSANFNSLFTVVNICVILFIMIMGFTVADVSHWTSKASGGFLPHGFSGVLAGAATCFYAYIGFECIAVGGEEAKDPAWAIPRATGLAMMLVTVAYVLMATSFTLMVPWSSVDPVAPFPAAFELNGIHWAKYIVGVGALLGITTSMMGVLFSLPRAVYAMSADGVFFRVFGIINPRTQMPLYALGAFSVLAAVLALLLDIETLVELLSIGTLLSFSLVAACVIVLRYQPATECPFKLRPMKSGMSESSDTALSEGEDAMMDDTKHILHTSQSHHDIGKLKPYFYRWPLVSRLATPGSTTLATVVLVLAMLCLNLVLIPGWEWVAAGTWWAVLLLIIFGLVAVAAFTVLAMHEKNVSLDSFQVPWVPLLPAVSIFLNIAMMIKLHYFTWIRLAVWVTIGYIIYFAYGIHHSNENKALASFNNLAHYGASTAHEANALNTLEKKDVTNIQEKKEKSENEEKDE